jgi:protein required for attachment to host cells
MQSVPMQSALTTESKSIVWILLANRSRAQIFATDGGIKNFHRVHEIDYPEGRSKGRDLESSVPGVESNFSSAEHRPRNVQVIQRFASKLCSILKKARAKNRFERLVLVAEPRLLGEIRSTLDQPTKSRVSASMDRDLAHMSSIELRRRLKSFLLPA